MDIYQTAGKQGSKILLIGDIDGVFLDYAVSRVGVEYHNDMSSGIEAAKQSKYRAIVVVMFGVEGLKSALQTLRSTNPLAKIILLAQMYEEPEAIELVSTSIDGLRIADDYLIRPVQAEEFYESVLSGEVRAAGGVFEQTDYKSASEKKIQALEKLATTDELTGLKNRRYVREFCRQIIEYARQRGGRVTLLMFDIDDFKQYNDIYGHKAGDEILQQVAVLLNRCTRAHDVVGRIGGDEFVVVFWDEPGAGSGDIEAERRSLQKEHPREAIFIARRFQRGLKKARLPLLGPEGRGVLTISGGLASFPRDGSDAEQLFAQADRALLEAKKSGKNRIYLVGQPQNDIADID